MHLLQADLVSEGKAHTDKIGTYTLFWSLLSTGSAERKRAEDNVDQQILATSQANETLEDQSRKRAREQDSEAFQNKQRKTRSLQTLKEQEERTRVMLSKHADPTYTLTYLPVCACMHAYVPRAASLCQSMRDLSLVLLRPGTTTLALPCRGLLLMVPTETQTTVRRSGIHFLPSLRLFLLLSFIYSLTVPT